MHVNWRGLLGGPLYGILPVPQLSADAYVSNRVFAQKAVSGLIAGIALPVTLVPDDSQNMLAQAVYRPHIGIFSTKLVGI